MQLSEGTKVSHPYFVSISCTGDTCEVVLNELFPAQFRNFKLRTAPEIWDGFVEVEGTLGLVEEDGRVIWLHGHGRTFEEAIQEALARFTNWVVHPADVCPSHFQLRTTAA